jgi:hypothetical protein
MKKFWSKFEFRQWRDDKDLKRCSKETRGFWIDCIAEMEDSETYFVEGTQAELMRMLSCTADEFERSVEELERTNAASVSKNQGFVKIVSRRLLKAINLKEYNKLKQREHRRQENVKSVSNAPSKDIEIKSIREERIEEKKEEEREEASTPEESNVVPIGFSPFESPPVVLFEEIFQIHVGNNFAKAVTAQVTDLGTWNTLLQNKRAFADKPFDERKRVCNWILDEYTNRVEAKNGTNNKPTSEREKSAKRVLDTERLADEIAAGLHNETVTKLFGGSDENSGTHRLTG